MKEVINKMEEEQNILDAKIGNKEVPKNTVSPAKVTIASVTIKRENKEGKKMDTPLAEFHIKHPDKDELLKITKVKYLDGETLKAVGFWVQVDPDGNFYKGSAVERILSKLGCETLADTVGKEIDTIEESKDSPYLCLKAY